MSESTSRSPDKSGLLSPSIIGYRFQSGSDELGELQEDSVTNERSNSESNLDVKTKLTLVSTGSLDCTKFEEDKSELLGEAVKDYWGLLGRSVSVDSTYQSPFSNPFETWRKLNELKGKITKTVEEKISEMKIDHNVSSHFKLNNSKDNSSLSDSEDTSEGSKMSEQWKETEELDTSLKEVINKTTDMLSNTLDALQNAKSEMEQETELRQRKSHSKLENISTISTIKIATAKKEDVEGSFLDESTSEDVEPAVEAERLDSTSLNALDECSFQILPGGGAQTPPNGSDTIPALLSAFLTNVLNQMYTMVFLFGFGLYLLMPMSDFYKGFFFCLAIVFFVLKLKNYLIKDDLVYKQSKPFVMPDYMSLPPLKVPEYVPVKGVWINEYERESYDPDYYSVTQTVPAYLELDNCILKLSRPKGKINRRATCDEPEYKMQFIHQRVYNISGCNVFLLPEGLTRKRLYSKKYPIVIFLRPDSFIGQKNLEEKDGADVNDGDDMHLTSPSKSEFRTSLYLFSRCDRQKEEWYRKLLAATRLSNTPTYEENLTGENEAYKKNPQDQGIYDNEGNNKKPSEEVLKGRDYEKRHVEDQHVHVAETSTPFEKVFFDPEVAQMEEYLRYMSRFVDVDSLPHDVKKMKGREGSTWLKKGKKKKGMGLDVPGTGSLEHINNVTVYKKAKVGRVSRLKVHEDCDLEEQILLKMPTFPIQWLNAFLNRILFDMFRSPYWLNKIHDKLYKKLNSIRLPYYVEEIEVIEMDLGKTGPMFHRVSQPYLDERGLWFDMDTTFEGRIKLTIQTHLNLVKLQKGIEEEEALKRTLEKPEKHKKKSKEPKDNLITKDSHEKSKGTVIRTKSNKKLEKPVPSVAKSSFVEAEEFASERKPEIAESDVNLVGKVSDSQLYNEVAQLAELALDPDLDDLPLKELHDDVEAAVPEIDREKRKTKSPIYDSDVEDSAESSEDDVEEEDEMTTLPVPPEPEEPTGPVSIARRYPKNRRSSKKLFRMFENVAQSKYFKSVAQSKYIQKAIAGVSATNLKLSLEITSCTGTLAINIPPPPSDRFWYGFRDMPKMTFSANPKIGEKSLKFSQIKNYLHKKILHEIKKAMIVPNMIDLILPTTAPGQGPSSGQTEEDATSPDEDLDERKPEVTFK